MNARFMYMPYIGPQYPYRIPGQPSYCMPYVQTDLGVPLYNVNSYPQTPVLPCDPYGFNQQSMPVMLRPPFHQFLPSPPPFTQQNSSVAAAARYPIVPGSNQSLNRQVPNENARGSNNTKPGKTKKAKSAKHDSNTDSHSKTGTLKALGSRPRDDTLVLRRSGRKKNKTRKSKRKKNHLGSLPAASKNTSELSSINTDNTPLGSDSANREVEFEDEDADYETCVELEEMHPETTSDHMNRGGSREKDGKCAAKRKRNGEDKADEIPEDCPLIHPESDWLPYRSWRMRQSCHTKLEIAISSNHKSFYRKQSSNKMESMAVATKLEYMLFATMKNLMLYNERVENILTEIERFTADRKLHPAFREDDVEYQSVPPTTRKGKILSHTAETAFQIASRLFNIQKSVEPSAKRPKRRRKRSKKKHSKSSSKTPASVRAKVKNKRKSSARDLFVRKNTAPRPDRTPDAAIDLTLLGSDSSKNEFWQTSKIDRVLFEPIFGSDFSCSSDSDSLEIISEYNRYEPGPVISLCGDEGVESHGASTSANIVTGKIDVAKDSDSSESLVQKPLTGKTVYPTSD